MGEMDFPWFYRDSALLFLLCANPSARFALICAN